MTAPLAPLRQGLDLMPSPVPDRPGLLVRDPFRYSDAILIVPPALVPCLMFFDGRHTSLDLREALVRLTGRLEVGDLMEHLTDTLATGGFLENEVFEALRDARHREFAQASRRAPAHAGASYPDDAEPLREALGGYLDGAADTPASAATSIRESLLAIAAPHVSLEGGWQSYRAAYRALGPEHRGKTFLLLGTSHYGEPECFGLTRKPFLTPLGETEVHRLHVDWLERQGGSAVRMEDYCHAVEHSLEFQVLFLQHLYGPGIRILPVLCGPFARSLRGEGRPEDDDGVRRFLGALGELASREGEKLLFVLGIDLAHVGRRYGDRFDAYADRGPMAVVADRDCRRLEHALAGDARGFWNLVRENGDDLRWCGSSPLYTFLKAAPGARGELLRYEQWNIDEQSVVSFAGLRFTQA